MPSRKRKPKPHPNPPRDLATRKLPLRAINHSWLRIHRLKDDPVYFGGNGDNRFDAPAGEFAVLYVAEDMFGAFVETPGHDTGTRLIGLEDLQERGLAQIDTGGPVQLVDLTGPGLAQVGADARLCSGPIAMAQRWSLAFYNHPEQPAGILYHSRHEPSRRCAALFDRMRPTITASLLGGLTDAGQFGRLGLHLDQYNFGIK